MSQPVALAEVAVVTRGRVPARARTYAAEKVAHATAYAGEPVLHARVTLTHYDDPARERPFLAEATLDVNGIVVRTQVAAASPFEAVDLLERRLQGRLDQLEDRDRTRHRWLGLPEEHEWRRGDLPTQRPEYFPRPVEEREIVRRKSVPGVPATPDEAAFDMEMLGHAFHLYTDSATGKPALMSRDDGGYLVSAPPSELTEEQAVEHLDLAGEPFVYYRDAATGRVSVLYRRYDGHYGLVTAT